MNEDRSVKVISIIGKGRSGSTLLDRVLGQLEGFFSVGELTNLWSWGLLGDARCGCGRMVSECQVWSRVLERSQSKPRYPYIGDAESVVQLQRRVVRWRHLFRLLARPRNWPDRDKYGQILSDTYRALADVTGAEVIVDSSKLPLHITPLGFVPRVDVILIHLVRDPRAVVHSWRRIKEWTDRDSRGTMPTYRAVYSVLSWLARNAVAEIAFARHRSDRRIRIRYEDFVDDPGFVVETIRRIAAPDTERMTIDRDNVQLGITHTVGGNPDRMIGGSTVIRPDDEWIRTVSSRDWWLCTIATAPFLKRYRYPLRRSHSAG